MEDFVIKSASSPLLVSKETAAGAAAYRRSTLALYDLLVLRFSCRSIWRCPSSAILDLYNEHISANHLDVGVGTGYFLDRCAFPAPQPRIALADLNADSLVVTARRLRRYAPATHRANALEPLQIEPANFDSIAVNFLLHCLPGAIPQKSVVFQHLKPLLNPAGKIFGATVLGKGVEHSAAAKILMRIYNSKGIFSNADDSLEDLKRALKENFREYELRLVGCAALFVGKV